MILNDSTMYSFKFVKKLNFHHKMEPFYCKANGEDPDPCGGRASIILMLT